MTPVLVVMGLMIAGLVLLAIEILVIPGFGVIGILGVLSILGSGYLAFAELGTAYAGLAVAGGVIGAGLMFWLLPKTRAARAMVLETRTVGSAADPALRLLVGSQGTALTPLRPAGSVDIDGKPVDVVSDGQYIEPGTQVAVVRVEGNRVVVEPLSPAS